MKNSKDSNKKLVLLIEDETDVASVYKRVLEDGGFEVLSIDNGTLGMKAIREMAWDVILLDIMLPGKHGINILEEISLHPELKKGKVVVITNLDNETTIDDAFKYGADSYIIKSEVTPDSLVAEIRK